MKKIIIVLFLLIGVGCTNDKEIINTEQENIVEESIQEEIDEYIDTNPIIVGLYRKGKLISEYNTKFKDRTDIATFNIVFTNDQDLGSTNLKNNWNKYYNNYENINEYKIGFQIEMEVNGKKTENILLNPENQHKLHPYLYAYLYDGINATGSYTHLTMKDIKDNTIYSSIKLYLHLNTKEISSPIYLTVFTYKNDSDFIDGHYRGNSKYTITINNK